MLGFPGLWPQDLSTRLTTVYGTPIGADLGTGEQKDKHSLPYGAYSLVGKTEDRQYA